VIILDTNILFALMRAHPDPSVITWLDRQPPESIWITSVTVFEVEFGLALLPASRRRTALENAYRDFVDHDLQSRVASFDQEAASMAAQLAATRQQAGQPVDTRDTEIAGIAIARRATLATRNVAHFQGLTTPVLNPWQSAP
jgi:predicted nucleic acid-binding protein